MSIEIQKEIQDSIILNLYNKLLKIADYVQFFKILALVFFFTGLLEIVIFGEIDKTVMYLSAIIYIPGILFAITMGIIHFLTGLKLKKLSEKYKIEISEVQMISENTIK